MAFLRVQQITRHLYVIHYTVYTYAFNDLVLGVPCMATLADDLPRPPVSTDQQLRSCLLPKECSRIWQQIEECTSPKITSLNAEMSNSSDLSSLILVWERTMQQIR